MDIFFDLVSYIVGTFSLVAAAVLLARFTDYIRLRNSACTQSERQILWGAAAGGSIVGSFLIGLLGVILAMVTYPNTQEYSAALIGGLFGSCLSIPAGILVGGFAGSIIADIYLRRRGERPGFLAGAGAFVMAALASGVSLVPIGFFVFGLAHI